MIGVALLAFCLALFQSAPSSGGPLDWISSGRSSCGDEMSHNFYFGQKTPYQRLLYTDQPKFASSLLRVRSEHLTYPVKGQQPAGTITYINVLDLRTDGTGGCVYITDGGVGSKSVTLRLKSQRSRGMEFLVNIFGT